MTHFQTVAEPKQPIAARARARRNMLQTVVNGVLFTAAFLFVVAVVCGLLP